VPRGRTTTPPTGEEFGDRLRRARLDRKLTQTQLAERSGVPQVTISALESKKRRPLLETADALAEALDMELDELSGKETPLPAALAEFLDSPLCPPDITDGEKKALARFRKGLGPKATSRTYAALLDMIRGTSGK
jgi:transcriptional regulator with XRE-family HTH domain